MRTIEVDLAAIRSNYELLKKTVAPAKVMAVVKANAYGHGMLQVAKALESAGADALGVADVQEAIAMRMSGIKSRIVCWIVLPADLELAADHDVEVGISTFEQLAAATEANKLHIKLDTGLGRNGFAEGDLESLIEELSGREVVGVFSHLSNTSESEDRKQKEKFDAAVEKMRRSGISISERHLAASAAAISYPDFHYEMVRCGIAVYGLNPYEDRSLPLPLKPAMRATVKLVNVKKVPAGQGVSYGYRYVTEKPTTLGFVPFGYGEGMPRISVGHQVLIAGKRYPVVGRVAMDQFVVDLGDSNLAIGEEVIIFGDPNRGEPSAEELGQSSQSINYEIVTRIGGRANRVYLNR
ncbi:MAG: alanine racemase [Aquiluna sp.]